MLALHRDQIAANAHLRVLNPHIDGLMQKVIMNFKVLLLRYFEIWDPR
mgnify:CR=1 FL=1